MKIKVLAVIVAVLSIGIVSSIYTSYLYVYHGKVVHADTKEPIEGAVVVAIWHEEAATPTGPTSRLKDVKETLSDRQGEWKIRGPKGGNIIASLIALITFSYYTTPPEFIVFKPGYCSWPAGFLIDACAGRMKPNGNQMVAKGETVELPKLSNREDRERNLPGTAGFSREFDKKQLNFLMSINEEHNYLYGEKSCEKYIRELESEK